MKTICLLVICAVLFACSDSPTSSSLVVYRDSIGKTDSVEVNGQVYRAGEELQDRQDPRVLTTVASYAVFRGDANVDTDIDIEDVSELIAYISNERPWWLRTSCYYKCADCDGDYWNVDIADLTLLIDYLFISGDYSVIVPCQFDPYTQAPGTCCEI